MKRRQCRRGESFADPDGEVDGQDGRFGIVGAKGEGGEAYGRAAGGFVEGRPEGGDGHGFGL